MSEKDNHFESDEKALSRAVENRANSPSELPIGPILNDLVTFADELSAMQNHDNPGGGHLLTRPSNENLSPPEAAQDSGTPHG